MTVGIFSRDGPDSYRWLIDFLHTFLPVGDVKTFWVSNTSRILAGNYTFAILYHSKTRGRLNITDVADSIYDEELEVLFSNLGKRNVIAVIDDLDKNSDEEKTRILMAQQSIGRKAQELFLFTSEVKLSKDANHVNVSNKRRMKEIIQAVRPSQSLVNRKSRESCKRMTRDFTLPIIITVLVVFGLACWWYNFLILQW